MAVQQFFYDAQIRRYIIQFIRMVSNFQVEFGRDRNGITALQRVPVIYGDSSRQAASIIKQGSENVMNAVPAMAAYVSGLVYDRARVQNPNYVSKLNLRERAFDPETGDYTTQQGNTFTVERLMPVPYKLTLKLDIWTSNTEQKLQLLEQLCTLFNPALEIQSTDNYIDWTSLTYVLLTDTQWSSRSVPVGTETPIDVATLTFELPIWISSPALIKKMGVIQKIITNIYDGDGNIDESIYNDSNLMSKQYYTPLNYGVLLLDNQLRLAAPSDAVIDEFGTQIIKEFTANISANATVYLDDTDGIEPGMAVSGLMVTGPGTITANIRSNIVTGLSTSLRTLKQGVVLFNQNSELGVIANVLSNTSVRLTSNAVANVSNVSYTYIQGVTTANTTVVSTNGDMLVCNYLVSGNIGDRIAFSSVTYKHGVYEPWRTLVNVYGNLTNGSSQVRLETTDGNEVVGTVAYNPTDDTVLLWTPDIDTLPVNTLSPVNAIIDPQSSRPSKDLQNLANGTRYLLVNDYVSTTQRDADGNLVYPLYNWQGVDNTPLLAYANDIIQYNGSHWVVDFDSRKQSLVNYVTNMTTNIQYRWDGHSWAKSYEGFYSSGKWQLVL
jgi:hypothetical protein